MVKALKIIFSLKNKNFNLFILHLHQQQKELINSIHIFKLWLLKNQKITIL